MKKSLFIICLLLSLSFAIAEFSQSERLVNAPKEINKDQKVFRVAILTPVTHPSLEQIQQGFCETLTRQGADRYQFTVYNAQGNQTLMRSELEGISGKHYDLILAIGTQAAKMSKEVLTKKQQTTPLVFAAVPNPENHHLQSESVSEGFVTGVSEVTDYSKQMELLAHLKPNLKSVLLVYDPTNAGLDRDKIAVENKLAAMGIRLIPIEVFKTNEIKQKVSPFIHEVDVVMTLKDNTVVAGLETLVKLCHTNQTLLMTSDLDSPLKGAAIGFGVKEYDFGAEAAKKAHFILHDGLPPHQIPITAVDQFKLKVNAKSMAQQGLQLDPFLHYLIEHGEGL